jgi:hypothetical protein
VRRDLIPALKGQLYHRICTKIYLGKNVTWCKHLKIQIRAIQIIDYLVYIKVQWTSNMTGIVRSHTPHSVVN